MDLYNILRWEKITSNYTYTFLQTIETCLILLDLVNGFKRHIVMAAPFSFTAPSSVQNLMNS